MSDATMEPGPVFFTSPLAQELANRMATYEWLAAHMAEIAGSLSPIIDALARELNAAGFDARACEQGDKHLAACGMNAASAISFKAAQDLHCLLIEDAIRLGLNLPAPVIVLPPVPPQSDTGGR